MGVAFYPVLNPAVPDYQPEIVVGGKAIAQAMPLLESWARDLAVRPLYDFYSESLEETYAHIGDAVPDEFKDQEEPIKWSAPADGMKTVRALVDRLRAESGPEIRFTDNRGRETTIEIGRLIRDLESLEQVLRVASERGSRFRIRIDV